MLTSQKSPVNNFQWIKGASQFNEDFMKNSNDKSDEGYFLKVDVHYHECHNGLPFLPERMMIEKTETLLILNKVNRAIKFGSNHISI